MLQNQTRPDSTYIKNFTSILLTLQNRDVGLKTQNRQETNITEKDKKLIL